MFGFISLKVRFSKSDGTSTSVPIAVINEKTYIEVIREKK
jgi:hypothetical protein